jgi:hypothetical protein
MAAGGEDTCARARDPRGMTSRAHGTVSAASGRRLDAESYVAFREALLDLVDEPTPSNVQRYLSASLKFECASSPSRPNRGPSG